MYFYALQPTSSTARLLAAKQQKKLTQNSDEVITGIYTKHKRPKSSKYDTYRLRARTSIVDESLFGEPLKNKLMSRSRSMEAISQEADDGQYYADSAHRPLAQPTLFTRRSTPRQQQYSRKANSQNMKRMERPRTALATMRPSKSVIKDPEFEKRSSGQGEEPGIVRVVTRDLVRSLIVPQDNTNQHQKPLVLSRHDFEKILKASQVITAEERDKIRRQQEEEKEAELKASEQRKADFDMAASFHMTPTETELDKENLLREHHIIEKAQHLKMEQMPEVKRLNEMIIQAKCHAIRDIQLEEKQRRLQEIADADRAIEEAVEIERKQAESMAASKQSKIVDFNRDYREGLDRQKAEHEAKKVLEWERHQAELEIRKNLEAEAREKDMKEAEEKRIKILTMKQQMMLDVEEARRKKAIEEENERLNNERIQNLQSDRREAEIRKEEEIKRAQREKEREMARMKKAVEQERELMLKREELRLARQQEEEDRAWRKREVEKARLQAEKEEKVRKILDIQILQRQEDAARSVEKEKKYWENIQSTWLEATEEEKQIADSKLKVRWLSEYFVSCWYNYSILFN